MRSLATMALCALALVFASCSDTPTSTTSADLGKTTIEEMQTNVAYRSWYETGYNAYPDNAGKVSFDSAVNIIKANFDPNVHSVVMAVKPNCGCQTTQLWMPRVMKALDAAGIPHEKVSVYITDAALHGIDDVKTKYSINTAPVFIVLKNDVVAGRINVNPTGQHTVEQELADAFAKP